MTPSDARRKVIGWLVESLQPPPHQYAWEWADEHRVLTKVSSGDAGPWRTTRTPYVKEPTEMLSRYVRVPDSTCPLGYRLELNRTRVVVIMKGSQMAGTEILLNWQGSNIAQNPGPAMLMFPTVDTGKRWSKQRLKPMIESTACLRDKIQDSRARDSGNEIMMKEYPGGFLSIVGSVSPAGLRGMAARDIACDDFDGFAMDAGGEGDPAELISNRQATFADAKTLLISTPTEKGFSNIERAYEKTDQRKYFVPCVNCGEYEVLTWAQIKWPQGEPEKAYCECLHCGFHLQNFHKNEMLAKGEWRPTAVSQRVGWVGYHLPSLYSPHGWESWGDIATMFVNAKDVPEKLQVVVNTKFAETFEDQAGEQVDSTGLLKRREAYTPDAMPDGVVVLTAAVDVQDDRVEVQIDGWGRDFEYWNLSVTRILGDPSVPFVRDPKPDTHTVWNDLEVLLAAPWVHPRFGELKVSATCVDTGGHHTLNAYQFCRESKNHRVWAIKGKEGKRPAWPRRPSRSNKGRVNLYLLGIDTIKDSIFAGLKVQVPGPSYRHYSMDRDQEYFDQLCSERRRTKHVRGFAIRYWYLPGGQRNEALDLSVYSNGALHGLIASGLNLNKRATKLDEQFPQPVEVRKEKPAAPVPVVSRPARTRSVTHSSYM